MATAAALGVSGRASAASQHTVPSPDAGYGASGYGGGGYGMPSDDGVEPASSNYTDDDGYVRITGVRDAISDWRAGEIDTVGLRDVIHYWRHEEQVV